MNCFNALRLTKVCILFNYCLCGARQLGSTTPFGNSINVSVRMDRCDVINNESDRHLTLFKLPPRASHQQSGNEVDIHAD